MGNKIGNAGSARERAAEMRTKIEKQERTRTALAITGVVAASAAPAILGLFGYGFNKLDSTTTSSTVTEVIEGNDEEVTEVKTAEEKREEARNKVNQILTNSNLNIQDENILNTIVDKYTNIVEYYQQNNIEINETELATRIEKYTKGLKYSMAEQAFIDASETITPEDENTRKPSAYDIQEVIDVVNENSTNWKQGFLDAAENYIASWDTKEGDGSIDFNEYIAQRASQIGIEDINQITPDLESELSIQFKVHDYNGDGKLSNKEIASKIWATASTESTKITFDEWYNSEAAVQTISKKVLNLNEEEKKVLMALFENKEYEMTKWFMQTKLNLNEEEKTVIDTYLNDLLTGFKNFS